MSSSVDDATLRLLGDTAPIDSALASLGPKADDSAKKVSTAFTGEFNKVSSASAALASAVGGPFGRIAGLANSAIRPIAEVASSLGGVAGGLALAGGAATVTAGLMFGLVAGLKGVVDSAVEAEKRLVDLGIEVEQSASDSLGAYSLASSDLSIALDELRVAAGSELAESFATIAGATAGVIRGFISVRDAVSGLREDFDLLLRGALLLGTLGLSELAIASVEMADASNEAKAATDGLTEAERMEAEATLDAAAGAWANTQAKTAETEAAKLLTEQIRAQAAAEREASAEAAEIRAALNKQNDEFVDARTAAEESANEKIKADSIAALRAISREEQKVNDQWARDVWKVADENERAAEKIAADHKAAQAAVLNATMQVADSTFASLDNITSKAYQSAADRQAAGEILSAAEVDMANRALALNQGLQITQAGIHAVVAGAGVIANMTPMIGLAAIPIGVAVSAGLFAASVTAIESGSTLQYSYDGGDGGDDFSGGSGTPGSGGAGGGGDAWDSGGNPKGENAERDYQSNARERGGSTLTIDPRLKTLSITTNNKPGKRPTRGGR